MNAWTTHQPLLLRLSCPGQENPCQLLHSVTRMFFSIRIQISRWGIRGIRGIRTGSAEPYSSLSRTNSGIGWSRGWFSIVWNWLKEPFTPPTPSYFPLPQLFKLTGFEALESVCVLKSEVLRIWLSFICHWFSFPTLLVWSEPMIRSRSKRVFMIIAMKLLIRLP